MKKLLSLLMIACWSLAFAGHLDNVFKNSLTGSLEDMRKEGWRLSSGVTATKDGLQLNATGGERKSITFLLPVQEGKTYGGSIKVKPMGVQLRNNNDRGATFFMGFADKKGGWVGGGEFPRGPMGTGDWTTVKIGSTREIPGNVGFIEIWIAIEGQGVAQFKDLEIHEVELASKWTVDATHNPPTFTYMNVDEFKSGRIENRLRIMLSQDPAFPENATFTEMVSTKGHYTLPYALKPGKWFVRGSWCGQSEFKPMLSEIEIKAIGDNPKLKVDLRTPNGTYSPRPELALAFYPEMPKTLTVTANGKALVEKGRKGNVITVTPAEDLPSGTYDIVVNANGHESKILLVNKNPGHTYSFRDDHMLILDGKPYFPIGTYRDPSDVRMEFSGVKEANFNMTHDYDFENANVTEKDMKDYLAACNELGLTAFMGVPRKYLKSDNTYELQKHCAAMYDSKGLGAYYLADEPELWINQYSLKNGADAVRAACPGVPRILLLCTPNDKSPVVKFMANGLSEIFWYDPYPIPNYSIRLVKDGMEAMRRATGGKQALWCVIQAFDWRQYDVVKLNPFDINPKAGQIRCMTHLALSADVQGIIYYWLPKARYDMRIHSPIQWAETKACAHELQSLYPYLIGRNAPQNLELPDGVFNWCRKAADGSYALALINSTDKPVEFPVKVLNFNKTVKLGPWGVEVLK